ncbi:DUF5133 domain-containing protein [Streptomyces chartreusis]|uniref:DUF5133 domain-containing protein n=1 Tax=Streptomyces chartreusis TaxID=1969 RepID=UPI003D90A4B0
MATHPSADTARRLEDATCTLCVVTGTRELDAALFVAASRGGSSARPVAPVRPPHHARLPKPAGRALAGCARRRGGRTVTGWLGQHILPPLVTAAGSLESRL